MKHLSVLFSLLLFSSIAWGQNCTVQGTVTDENGELLLGVSVYIKGTNKGTSTYLDGKYTIEVPDSLSSILVFSYVGFETREVPVRKQNKIDITLKEQGELIEEINYYFNRSIVLEGASNYAHYGLGWYFWRHGLWNRWLHLPVNTPYSGEVSYHTDFKDNREIHINIEEIDGRKFLFNGGFNRYNIPELAMNINKYNLGVTFHTHDYKWNINPGIEYLDWRENGKDDELSATVAVRYGNWYSFIRPKIEAGISLSGKPMFMAGAQINKKKWLPVNINLSAGYWMEKFKCKAEISHEFKYIDIGLTYERFLNYENAYLTFKIPYKKFYGGFSYQNLLK